jgi:hypothetical protein
MMPTQDTYKVTTISRANGTGGGKDFDTVLTDYLNTEARFYRYLDRIDYVYAANASTAVVLSAIVITKRIK